MIRSWLTSNKDERVIIEYDDTTRAWNDWKHGNIIQKSSVHERFITSLVECTKMYTTHNNSFKNSDFSGPFDIPSLVKTAPEINENCHRCRKYQGQLYPCRICGKVYHQECIKDIEDTKSYYLIKNATNLIGWSCPICEDLRALLSPNEIAETNEWIKSLGTQTISNLDNYINNRIKSKSSVSFNQLNDRMKNILQNFLNTISDITSNRLSQTDLFTLDICLKILRIPSKFLVNSLTQFELYRLSQLFISLSSNDNQCITYNKFHQIFHTYLLTTMPELNPDQQHSHLEALAYSFLGHMIKFDRTWTQFILDATIPTLLGRLNYRIPSDFITHRIVSIKHSTSPSTANFRDAQSISILIKNVLQKLTQTIGTESESVKNQHRTKRIKTKKRENKTLASFSHYFEQ